MRGPYKELQRVCFEKLQKSSEAGSSNTSMMVWSSHQQALVATSYKHGLSPALQPIPEIENATSTIADVIIKLLLFSYDYHNMFVQI